MPAPLLGEKRAGTDPRSVADAHRVDARALPALAGYRGHDYDQGPARRSIGPESARAGGWPMSHGHRVDQSGGAFAGSQLQTRLYVGLRYET